MTRTTDARTVMDRSMTEDQLLTALTEWATFRGWCWHHIRRADKAEQMGTPGFPDVVFARGGRVLFVELKSENGRLDHDQWAWAQAVGAEPHRIWRPSDLDRAIEELR